MVCRFIIVVICMVKEKKSDSNLYGYKTRFSFIIISSHFQFSHVVFSKRLPHSLSKNNKSNWNQSYFCDITLVNNIDKFKEKKMMECSSSEMFETFCWNKNEEYELHSTFEIITLWLRHKIMWKVQITFQTKHDVLV